MLSTGPTPSSLSTGRELPSPDICIIKINKRLLVYIQVNEIHEHLVCVFISPRPSVSDSRILTIMLMGGLFVTCSSSRHCLPILTFLTTVQCGQIVKLGPAGGHRKQQQGFTTYTFIQKGFKTHNIGTIFSS